MVGCAVFEHHCAGHDAGHNTARAREEVLGPRYGAWDDWIENSERALDMAEKAERMLGRSHHDEGV